MTRASVALLDHHTHPAGLAVSFSLPVIFLQGTRQPRNSRWMTSNGLLSESREQAKELELPANDQANEYSGLETAEKLMERFNDPEFQAELLDEQQRLRQTLFKDIIAGSLSQDDQEIPEVAISNPEQLYLFISSSVPLTTLRNYAAMIDRARTTQVSMVLRGFVGGMKKIRPTMEFIGEILKKDPACDLLKEQCDSYPGEHPGRSPAFSALCHRRSAGLGISADQRRRYRRNAGGTGNH